MGNQSPNPAAPSSTGPASSLSDTSSAPASFGLVDSQSRMEPPVKINSSSSAGRVTDRWTEPTLIGVKPTPSPSAASRATPGAKPVGPTGMVGRRALPGLANPAAVAAVDKDEKPVLKDKEQHTSVPPSPTRHTRIPSTGNRALVMEVAQALNEAAQQGKEKEVTEITADPISGSNSILATREGPSTGLGGPAAEKRKSSYERYSAIAMPPLAEERTPAASPVNTMSRSVGQNVLGDKVASESPLGSLRIESAGTTEQSPSAPSPSPSSKVHIGEDECL